MFLPHPRVKVSIVGSLRDREVACSASNRQGPNFESCVCMTVSSKSSHHPEDVLLAQFSLYVHKGGLKPDSFHFFCKVTVTAVCLCTADLVSTAFYPLSLLCCRLLFCAVGYTIMTYCCSTIYCRRSWLSSSFLQQSLSSWGHRSATLRRQALL